MPSGVGVYPHDAGPREEGGAALDLHAHATVINLRYRALDRAGCVRIHVPQARLPPDPRIRCQRRRGGSGLSHVPQYTAGSWAKTFGRPSLGYSARRHGPPGLELAMVWLYARTA